MAINPFGAFVCYVISLQISMIRANNVFVSFDLNSSSVKSIALNGDAQIVSGSILDLTDMSRGLTRAGSAGRAAYSQPIPLWNASSKQVANFTTHFQFQMEWNPDKNKTREDKGGNGLAFFMASAESAYQAPYSGDGGYLGLFSPQNNGNRSNQVVAVEFDTYKSFRWDLDNNHVGIDVNGLTSEARNHVQEPLNNGEIWDARIDYSGLMQLLEVSVSKGSKGQSSTHLVYSINVKEYLPENVVVGFSAATCRSSESHRLISWSFTSVIWQPPEKNPPSPKPSKQKKTFPTYVMIIVSICLVAVIILCLGLWFVLQRHGRRKRESSNMTVGKGTDVDMILDHVPRRFAYSELSAATNHFSEKEKLGHGGFGDVYRGILLRSGEIVAVKRISEESKQGKKEYQSEVTTITRLRHRNLVQLLGWCHERGQLMLVYEYMPNGSLDSFLFGQRRGALDWNRRYRIASDIASALLYLHESWEECVVHRDIKSSNVLLDSEFNAKLGDFGLARLVKHNECSQTTTVAGTQGYMAPECALSGISSAESDVFSFGAVALEIACGRRAFDFSLGKPKMLLVEWVWNLHGQGRLLDEVDTSLNGQFESKEMEQLMMIGLLCSHSDPSARPTIKKVLQLLNFEVPMPHLSKAGYSATQEAFFSRMSDYSQPGTSSQEMAVYSSSAASSDMATSSAHSTNSTVISKSSGSLKHKVPDLP